MSEPSESMPGPEEPVRAVVVTVSTSRAAGAGDPDAGGDALAGSLQEAGCRIVGRELVPDDPETIALLLRRIADAGEVDLIATTGGTGFTPDDRTPEATRAVIDRQAPGIEEAMRLASRDKTPNWWLSRGTAGIRKRTIIANWPGSPRACVECTEAIAPGLAHAVRHLRGDSSRHD